MWERWKRKPPLSDRGPRCWCSEGGAEWPWDPADPAPLLPRLQGEQRELQFQQPQPAGFLTQWQRQVGARQFGGREDAVGDSRPLVVQSRSVAQPTAAPWAAFPAQPGPPSRPERSTRTSARWRRRGPNAASPQPAGLHTQPHVCQPCGPGLLELCSPPGRLLSVLGAGT